MSCISSLFSLKLTDCYNLQKPEKERKTGREVRKKRRELREGAHPTTVRQSKTTHTRHVHRNERLTVLLAASNKRRHSSPGHQCFEKFISHQLGLRRPTLPKLRHLLTKLMQRQRTPLAIIRCFLDFGWPHTPGFTLGSHHPAAATLRSGSLCQRLG